MTKSEIEALYAKWLAERMNPKDKEDLAAFRSWLEGRTKDPTSPGVTVDEVLLIWERMKGRRKLH